jgi:hypothetical protein
MKRKPSPARDPLFNSSFGKALALLETARAASGHGTPPPRR